MFLSKESISVFGVHIQQILKFSDYKMGFKIEDNLDFVNKFGSNLILCENVSVYKLSCLSVGYLQCCRMVDKFCWFSNLNLKTFSVV